MQKVFWIVVGLIIVVTLAQGEVWVEWAAIYSGPGGSQDEPFAIAVNSLGSVYITGESYWSQPTSYDYVTFKYDSMGVVQWMTRYNGPASSYDRAEALALGRNGSVFVTGYSNNNSVEPNFDFLTVKYNSRGREIWTARYNGPGNDWDWARAIVVDGSGNIIVTGESDQGGGYPDRNSDYCTIKYDTLGNQLWVARYNGTANGPDYPVGLAVDNQNNVYVTGYCQYDTIFNWWTMCVTVKYDPFGNELWAVPYHQIYNDKTRAIAVDSSGNVYVTGMSDSSDGLTSNILTIKYDTNGNLLWDAHFSGPGYGDKIGNAIFVDRVGNVIITGGGYYLSSYDDIITVKYNSAGIQQWYAIKNGPDNNLDEGTCVKVDTAGAIYTAGYMSFTPWDRNFTVIKYSPQGHEEWVALWDGPLAEDDDQVNAMDLDSKGNVYVTGRGGGSGMIHHYATVKFSQTQLITISMTPLSPPIQIPAPGGSFNFNASITRMVAPQTPFMVWARIKFPNGTYTGPTLGPISINPPVNVTVTRQRTQTIPGFWPPGNYTYLGYVNTTFTYPAIDSSSFNFTKLATGAGPCVWETSCTGELFPGEEITQANPHPSSFILHPSVPNPFNTYTVASYELPVPSQVSLRVYDTAGRLVTTLVDGFQQAGTHSAMFDGSGLAAGVYIARLQATEGGLRPGEFTAAQKLVLLK